MGCCSTTPPRALRAVVEPLASVASLNDSSSSLHNTRPVCAYRHDLQNDCLFCNANIQAQRLPVSFGGDLCCALSCTQTQFLRDLDVPWKLTGSIASKPCCTQNRSRAHVLSLALCNFALMHCWLFSYSLTFLRRGRLNRAHSSSFC